MASEDPIVPTEEQQREQLVASRIRKLAGFALAIGTLLLWLSFVNVRVTTVELDVHYERAIPIEHLLWIIAAVVPAGWVMRAPHKKPLLVWACVFVVASIGMGLWTWRNHHESVDPSWPRVVALIGWLTRRGQPAVPQPTLDHHGSAG